MQGDRVDRFICKGKSLICRFIGHDFYVSDVKRIKAIGDSTHAICAFCHNLFKVTAVGVDDYNKPDFKIRRIRG